MKFALALVALAMVAAVNAMPTPETTYEGQGLTEVEQNQVNARIIVEADKDLAAVESQLEEFAGQAEVIAQAAQAMTTAMDKTGYAEPAEYIHST